MESFLQRYFFKCKIHRATVTQADLNYNGSITIDEDLLDAAELSEHEKVHVLDITNGNRIETYIIKGERGSGEICINGAAAHLIHTGDLVIIVAYCILNESEISRYEPITVHVDEQNRIAEKLPESVLSIN